MLPLDPRSTALVLIDLQGGIVAMPVAPRSGPEVVAGAQALAARFRTAGAPVILVRVGWTPGLADMPGAVVDQPINRPATGFPPGWSELVDGLAEPQDILITKRQWGAFYGTELDLQLRRRGVQTVVLGGIATNFGVESTARQAWELSYDLVVVEDLCASVSAELHEMSIRHIMPRIARVSTASTLTFTPA